MKKLMGILSMIGLVGCGDPLSTQLSEITQSSSIVMSSEITQSSSSELVSSSSLGEKKKVTIQFSRLSRFARVVANDTIMVDSTIIDTMIVNVNDTIKNSYKVENSTEYEVQVGGDVECNTIVGKNITELSDSVRVNTLIKEKGCNIYVNTLIDTNKLIMEYIESFNIVKLQELSLSGYKLPLHNEYMMFYTIGALYTSFYDEYGLVIGSLISMGGIISDSTINALSLKIINNECYSCDSLTDSMYVINKYMSYYPYDFNKSNETTLLNWVEANIKMQVGRDIVATDIRPIIFTKAFSFTDLLTNRCYDMNNSQDAYIYNYAYSIISSRNKSILSFQKLVRDGTIVLNKCE